MKRFIYLIVAAAVSFACVVQADNMSEAKARRRARKAQIVELVKAGAAQEGAEGYLISQSSATAAQVAVIKAENADRRIGYETIAKANGKTAEEIGRQAALAIQRARREKR